MMDEDLRSCDMWLFVGEKRKDYRQNTLAWSRNLRRSEQRNKNYTHNQKMK